MCLLKTGCALGFVITGIIYVLWIISYYYYYYFFFFFFFFFFWGGGGLVLCNSISISISISLLVSNVNTVSIVSMY